MPHMEPTEVMMLGNLQPPLRVDFLNPARTSPAEPQNLMRQTIMNGLGRIAVSPSMVRVDPGPGPLTVGQLPYSQAGRWPAMMGQVSVETPAIGPGTAELQLTPGYGRFALPSIGPGQFRLFGLGQGSDNPAFQLSTEAKVGWGVLSLASGLASTYHGYQRNKKMGWAALWGVMGLMFPILTPAVGIAQGFGKRKRRR